MDTVDLYIIQFEIKPSITGPTLPPEVVVRTVVDFHRRLLDELRLQDIQWPVSYHVVGLREDGPPVLDMMQSPMAAS